MEKDELQKAIKSVYIAQRLTFYNEKPKLSKILFLSKTFCQKFAIN